MRAYAADGSPLELALVPFSSSLAATVVSLQKPHIAGPLEPSAISGAFELQPFERGRHSVLAAPLDVAPGVQGVFELFDKKSPEGGLDVPFTAADLQVAAAAAEFGAELLRQALAERQTHSILLDAVAAALGASESVTESLRGTAAQRLEEPPPAPVLDQEVLSLLTPERLLGDPAATGEGVAVCLIDSGVEQALLEEKHSKNGRRIYPIEGAVFVAGDPRPRAFDGHQSTPHGTTVADIILTMAPRVRLYSADVFGPQGTCDVEQVIRALRHAIDVWKCKIVNLSLGVPEDRLQQVQRRYQFQRAIEEAYYRDVVLCAAAHNEHPLTRSYPAAFAPPLLSVDKSLFADPLQFAYRLREQVEFVAHGRGYLGPFANEPATSWAAPHLAGIAARLLSLRPGLKPFEIKTLLYWMFLGKQGSDGQAAAVP
jgi:hypothetical protein